MNVIASFIRKANQKDSMSTERWQHAQEKEKEFWLSLDQHTLQLQSEGYRILAGQLQQRIDSSFQNTANLRILQVGCAVEDCIFYLPYKFLSAIDPLADFYKANFERSRNPLVDYRTGRGEDIPYETEFFHVTICNNMLDHVIDPHKVVGEIVRVLQNNGLSFISVDVYGEEEAQRKRELEKQGIVFDECHPHVFTRKSLEQLVVTCGLSIVELFEAPSGKGDDSLRYCILSRK